MRSTKLAILFGIALFTAGVAVNSIVARPPAPKPFILYTIIDANPLAYYPDGEWTSDFEREQQQLPSVFTFEPGHGNEITGTMHGAFYNIAEGQRATVGQPAVYQHTIYVLGASTVFAPNVADRDTIPSRLQVLVRASYRVVNVSAPGINDAEVWYRLQAVRLAPGDMVILYDTMNDLLGAYNASSPALLSGITDQIAATADSMRHYAAAHGASFYFAIPPSAFARPLSASEATMINNPVMMPPGAGPYIVQQSSLMAQRLAGFHPLNLFALFADRHDVFIDHAHLNGRGNAVVARAIYETIFPIY